MMVIADNAAQKIAAIHGLILSRIEVTIILFSEKSLCHQRPGLTNQAIPLESRAGIDFIGLYMIMPKKSLVGFEIGFRQLPCNQLICMIAWIIAFDLGKDRAKRRRELGQCFVLLRRQVILDQRLALDFAHNWLTSVWPERNLQVPDSAFFRPIWNGQNRLPIRPFGIPEIKWILGLHAIGTHIGDFNAD